MVDGALPGDRVKVTGIFRAAPTRVNPRLSQQKAVFRTYVDVVHVEKTERGRLSAEMAPSHAEGYDAEFQPAGEADAVVDSAEERARRAQRVQLLAERPDLYAQLASSLAPSIWGLEDVKKGLLLLQLFGGVNKDLQEQGRSRGEVNVLLCGDPGTSKSQLLGYVNKIAPRGIYTSGKGSSAVGLTAYVTKDPETREPVLESGALVLSDRGVCCIDEFDKMSDSTRSILHEVMEQQTVSVAKAGIICTLNARTSVLASANPVESRYNPRLSVVDNIQLPPALLSRFDLIYLVLDHCDPASDRLLAKHLVSLFYKPSDRPASAAPPISAAQLTEYIAWARAHVHPALSEPAAAKLVDLYRKMRRAGAEAGEANGRKVIAATPRQLNSLIRLSEAHARMRLSDSVEESDVAEAHRLVQVATLQAAVDPKTGQIDMDRMTTGLSAGDRDVAAQLQKALLALADDEGRARQLPIATLAKRLQEGTVLDVDQGELVRALISAADLQPTKIRFDTRRQLVTFNP
jgi:DNA replication licensing factor MCM4